MLKLEYLNRKIAYLKKEIKKFEKSELEHNKEHAEHLRHLLDAYSKERIKAYSRPEEIEEDDYYIFDNFPRRGEFV